MTSTVLTVLEAQGPEAVLSVEDIVAGVRQRYDTRDRTPGANEIRGRLSQLHKEGVVGRPERGRYTLTRTESTESDALRQLTDIVESAVRPDALRRTVLWDASQYLQLAEDGGSGTRLVVEHEQATSLRDEVEVGWPNDQPIATWTTRTTGPLGPRLWEPEGAAPYRITVGIVFVDRGKLGATGLTPGGYRTPFPERILVEFLGEAGPPEAAPIVRTVLDEPGTDLDRLQAAAESLGADVELATILSGLSGTLRPELSERFEAELPPVVQSLIREAR